MYKIPDIKAMRKARGMTQEQVGILAGMSKSQISRMEKGLLGSLDTYERVLDALGYDAVVQYNDVRGDIFGKEQILSILKVYYSRNKEEYGIERIGLFGSFARSEEGAESDVDIIISLSKPNLFLYSTIARQLETVFGRKVDLISAKSHMSKEFLNQLEKEAIYVS